MNDSVETDKLWLPEGFVLVVAPDDNKYIVHEHIVPALLQHFKANEFKKDLKTFMAPGAVSIYSIAVPAT